LSLLILHSLVCCKCLFSFAGFGKADSFLCAEIWSELKFVCLNAIMDVYAKCGEVENSMILLKELPDLNDVT
jgi:hypothetical protein